MKKILYAICFLMLLPVASVSAQNKFDVRRLEVGGIFGASFGSNSSSVKISPQVGYAITEKFSAGVGVGYTYYGYDNISENYAGMNLYARLRPWRYIQIHAQPELYRTWGTFESEVVPCFLIGGGVILPMGTLGGISFSLSYDLIQNNRTPYSDNLIYSIGYVFGF
ncbi:MAG: hypothetical protein LIO93_12985 [Bacteroidales bacterium]|nr:hypothetical protein [Bacteroidales bacterium]